MKKNYPAKSKLFLLLIIFLWGTPYGFAQLKEEQQNARVDELAKSVIKEKQQKKRLWQSVELSGSYDTNTLLGQDRNGDIHEAAGYALSYERPLGRDYRMNVNYNLNIEEYNELTDVSNVLNHLKFSLTRSLNRYFALGSGYDFTSFYYPRNEEGDFLFHKSFIFLKNKLTKSINQQVMYERGYKNYTFAKALDESSSVYQDKDRVDIRHMFEYSISSVVSPKLFLKLRNRIFFNDSNAKFEDYYDYKSYDISPRLNYSLTKKLSLNWNLNYTRKDYLSRNASGRSTTQQDKIYATTLGMRYKLTKQGSLSASYSYNEASSNDPSSEYSGSSVSGGWQADF